MFIQLLPSYIECLESSAIHGCLGSSAKYGCLVSREIHGYLLNCTLFSKF